MENPFSMELADKLYSISYCPDESSSMLFGGNSNWSGPIWLCSEWVSLHYSFSVLYKLPLLLAIFML